MTVRVGGWGNIPHGQHEWGAAKSDIEPRFNFSAPSDGQANVDRGVFLEFEVYYYSSFPNEYDDSLLGIPEVEISEDKGATFYNAAQAPYALTKRLKAGHIVWYKVVKTGLWTANTEVIIRTTLPDEFEQAITKISPVRWS